MPDLLTHTASAWLVGRTVHARQNRILFLLGAILPDVLSRPFYIIWPQIYFYTIAVHTPFFMLFFILFVSDFFQNRQAAIKYLGLGTAFHFLFDAVQKHLLDGYYWLFPFSWWSYSGGLWWPNEILNFIPMWIGIILLLEAVLYVRRKRLAQSR